METLPAKIMARAVIEQEWRPGGFGGPITITIQGAFAPDAAMECDRLPPLPLESMTKRLEKIFRTYRSCSAEMQEAVDAAAATLRKVLELAAIPQPNVIRLEDGTVRLTHDIEVRDYKPETPAEGGKDEHGHEATT